MHLPLPGRTVVASTVTFGLVTKMPSDFGHKVARRIRELREASGLSVRELARRAGLPPESVSRSERAVTEITLTNLARLCAGLGIDLPIFFEFSKGVSGTQAADTARLTVLLEHLEPDRRRATVKAIETLLSVSLAGPRQGRPQRRRPPPSRNR